MSLKNLKSDKEDRKYTNNYSSGEKMICVRKKSCATLPQQMGKPGGNGRFPRIRELSKN